MKLFKALLPTLLLPSITSATVVAVSFTGDRIILAADSRETVSGRINDHVCKIIELDNHSVFFATGPIGENYVATGASIWNGADLSKKAFNDSGAIDDDFRLIRTVSNWGALMQKRYEQDLAALATKNGRRELAQGFFASLVKQSMQMYRIGLNYAGPPLTPHPIIGMTIQEFKSGDLPLQLFGDDRAAVLASEFLSNDTQRAKVLNASLIERLAPRFQDFEARKMQAAIQAAIQWNPNGTVGGSVDLMVLDPAGIRWIDRKEECKTETR